MKLRPELMPPVLNKKVVARLARLAANIDYGDPLKTRNQLAAFNREAGTCFEFIDFQGIYGGQTHKTWVRKVLATPFEQRIVDITRPELIEMARRIMQADYPEHTVAFWLNMLEINIPDPWISDLFFWPDEYFGHEGYPQDLSPEQVIDIALKGRPMTDLRR